MGSILNHNMLEFSKKIEEIVCTKKMSYMDAILYFCEENELDPLSITNVISDAIKEKIQIEAEDLNLLPKINRLPI